MASMCSSHPTEPTVATFKRDTFCAQCVVDYFADEDTLDSERAAFVFVGRGLEMDECVTAARLKKAEEDLRTRIRERHSFGSW